MVHTLDTTCDILIKIGTSVVNIYKYRITGIPHFSILHLIVLCRCCIFNKLKVCCDPASSRSTGTIFLTAFAQFVSLSHLWGILTIFKIFQYYYICHGDLRSVVFSLLLQIFFGGGATNHTYKTL